MSGDRRTYSVRVEITVDLAADEHPRAVGEALAERARKALRPYGDIEVASYVLRRDNE